MRLMRSCAFISLDSQASFFILLRMDASKTAYSAERTTISIPREIFEKAKAKSSGQKFSNYVRDLVIRDVEGYHSVTNSDVLIALARTYHPVLVPRLKAALDGAEQQAFLARLLEALDAILQASYTDKPHMTVAEAPSFYGPSAQEILNALAHAAQSARARQSKIQTVPNSVSNVISDARANKASKQFPKRTEAQT